MFFLIRFAPQIVLLVGGFGFAATLGYDLIQLRGRSGLLSLFAILGALFVSVATIALLFVAPVPPLLSIATIAGFVFAAIFAVLLVWSVVIEIPHSDIAESEPRTVVSTGTYGIVRHPGWLWYLLLNLSIVAVFRDRIVVLLSGYLVLLDLVVVLVEDRYIFPKLFVDYRAYQARVPILFPRLSSLFHRRRSDAP